MIQVGDALPNVTLRRCTGYDDAARCPTAPERVELAELVKDKKAVIFGVPGAFTPTCSAKHLPGYVEAHEALRAKGVDLVICVAVADAFVMAAWGRDQSVGDRVLMLGDGNAELARALGLEADRADLGMGTRFRRFSMLVDGGVVKSVHVEAPSKLEVSDAASMLARL